MVGIQTSHNFSVNEEFRKQVALLANTPQAKAKRRQTFAVNKHQQGEKNSNYGRVWCVKETDSDCSRRKPYKIDEIPEGWITTKEFKDRNKKKNHSTTGKQWWTDGVNNYYLNPNSSNIDLEKMRRGRVMIVILYRDWETHLF